MQDSISDSAKPRIGPHIHRLVLTGQPMPLEDVPKNEPESRFDFTYDNKDSDAKTELDNLDDLLPRKDLAENQMELAFRMDERLNNFRHAWQKSVKTRFQLYDYESKKGVPLNYKETENLDDASDGHFKTILMIPLHFANSTVLAVPEPDQQTADLYLLEMPITQVIEVG